MTKVVALQTWSNGTITMDEKSVLDIEDALATDLIAKGICADASTYFGGGSTGPLIISDTYVSGGYRLTATWQQIYDAMKTTGVVFEKSDSVYAVKQVSKINSSSYKVFMNNGSNTVYEASSPSAYPTNND